MLGDPRHCWIANFSSKGLYGEFFGENYSEDDDVPLSEFSASQGRLWYDHDWLEVSWSDEGLEKLIEKYVPDRFTSIVWKLVKKAKIQEANAIVFFYEDWDEACSKDGDPQIWYLGDLEAQVIELTPPYNPGDIPPHWWTELPDGHSAIEALQKKAETGDPSIALKIALMHLTGQGLEKDDKKFQHYWRLADAKALMRHEALLAFSKYNDAETWMQLYNLHDEELIEGVSLKNRLHYISTAAALGHDQARLILAWKYMGSGYSRNEFRIPENHKESEALLLAMDDNHIAKAHALFCLYSREQSPVHNPVKAFYWRKKAAKGRYSQFDIQQFAMAYLEGKGVDQDMTEAAKYFYLSACQHEDLSEWYHDKFARFSAEQLVEGRSRAKTWIANEGGKASEFEKEVADHFPPFIENAKKQRIESEKDGDRTDEVKVPATDRSKERPKKSNFLIRLLKFTFPRRP